MMEEVLTGDTYSIGFLKQLEKITNIFKCKHLYRLSVHKPEVACTFTCILSTFKNATFFGF